MVVEVPNRPAAEVMDEEDAEQDEDEEKEVVAAEESATSSAKRAKVGRKTKEKAHEKKTGSGWDRRRNLTTSTLKYSLHVLAHDGNLKITVLFFLQHLHVIPIVSNTA